ncbi:DUF3426 domain-containing protein [Pseudoxanthomonas sp. UTMC 1351]|uniref:DUF3426 domain-containing protein n=1 Tax=Pseudoxanthomonas sp. UTMC 1351 TaxID=2695853 RepID=UPI0034CF650B
MFAACPHCHFLIALHPQKRVVPAICPRCGKQVDDGSSSSSETAAVETGEEMPVALSTLQTESGATEPAPVDAAMHNVDAQTVDADDGMDSAEETSADSPRSEPETNDDPGRLALASAMEASVVAPSRENPPPAAAHLKTAIPSFTHAARTAEVRTHVPRWQWIALIALSLLLAIQVLLADRVRLAADDDWRPFVARLCGVFRCSIPVWRQPEAFTMLSRDVRPVAGSPGTLQAQATFRNDAHWAQAWPIVLLTLKDADGRTLGARALMPSEYLGAGQIQSEIAPGQSAQIAVRIREPSANVVAFSFDFR